jgi:rhodanese-related sulfurtransferase
MATKKLKKLGFEEIYDLQGGFQKLSVADSARIQR